MHAPPRPESSPARVTRVRHASTPGMRLCGVASLLVACGGSQRAGSPPSASATAVAAQPTLAPIPPPAPELVVPCLGSPRDRAPIVIDDVSLFAVFGAERTGSGRIGRGLVDRLGREVAAARFDDARDGSGGLAAVRLRDRWGFVDERGTLAIPPKWREVGAFSEGLALVIDAQQEIGTSIEDRVPIVHCGYVDRTGATRIAPEWVHDCGPFHDGRARWIPYRAEAYSDPTGGYIDPSGKMIFGDVKMVYGAFSVLHDLGPFDFHDGFVYLPRRGLLDREGNPLALPAGWKADGPFSDGLAPVRPLSRPSERTGFVDTRGALVLAVAGEVWAFHDARAPVRPTADGPFGYIDRCGRTVVPPTLHRASEFAGGVAVALDAGQRFVLLDTSGAVVLSAKHGPAEPRKMRGTLLRVVFHDRAFSEAPPIEGLMDRAGKFVWLSPGILDFVTEAWVRDHYIGPPERSPLRAK